MEAASNLAVYFVGLALVAPFSISDTTDNDTGKRTVYAMQIDQNLEPLSFMYLRCVDRRPTVEFSLFDFNAPDWVVVTLDGGDEADTPYIFERIPDSTHDLRLYGDASGLMSKIQEGEIRQFTAHSPLGNRSFSIDMEGMAKAWQRVTTSC